MIHIGYPVRSVVFFLSSANHCCLTEIAQIYKEGFENLGIEANLQFDRIPEIEVVPTKMQIIVGPHEFFPLFVDRVRPESCRKEISNASYFLTTERPGTPWFEIGCQLGVHARGVFDTSDMGARELRKRRVKAIHTPLGYASILERRNLVGKIPKDIDIVFLGTSTPKRDLFFSRYASILRKYNHRLLLNGCGPGPRSESTQNDVAERNDLLLRSKIIINIHWGEQNLFEWHRAICSIANRCLVISELSESYEPLEDKRHLVFANLRHIAEQCQFYLQNEPARSEIVDRAYEFLKTNLGVARSCEVMLDTSNRDVAITSADTGVGTLTVEIEAKRQAHIKQIEVLEKNGPGGGETFYSSLENGAYAKTTNPCISVIITLYNYSAYIIECLESVERSSLAGIPGGIEVLVIDDASTDTSVEVAKQFLEKSTFSMRLICKHLNTGISDALNLGVWLSRSRYLFMLDADNLVYPDCLTKLYGAISSSKAAGSYGIINMIDNNSYDGVGLLSQRAWDVKALLAENYIDSMAMLDRECVLAVGGFSIDLVKYGWWGNEDYDLWLKFAQRGYFCQFVPEILAAYRVHHSSLLSSLIRSGYQASLDAHFHSKFETLFNAYLPAPTASSAIRPADRIPRLRNMPSYLRKYGLIRTLSRSLQFFRRIV